MLLLVAAGGLGASSHRIGIGVGGGVRAHGMRRLSGSEPYGAVTCIGVDEHVWHHTAVVDLTPRADGRTARLLDMVPGVCVQLGIAVLVM